MWVVGPATYLGSLHYLFLYIQGVSAFSDDTFEDTWDYKYHFNNSPLISESSVHVLPSAYNITEQSSGKENSNGDIKFSPYVENMVKSLNLKQVIYELENSEFSNASCTACKAGFGILQKSIKAGKTEKDLKESFIKICDSMKIQSSNVCQGVTDTFAGQLYYILKESTLDSGEICAFMIGDACGDVQNASFEWNISFSPLPKPTPQPRVIPKPEMPTFKVLHLSDTHYDPYYRAGSNADCGEPLCCRMTSGIAETKEQTAGKWGDYRKCDTPKITLDHMLKHIAETHQDIDYIIWTGDLPPHDIWNHSKNEYLQILKDTVQELFTIFPGIPIFPALGNHESVPVNSFPSPEINQNMPEHSINWLYEQLDIQWKKWLPSSVSNTVLRGGFYSVLVSPGFRIISLNMNFCYNLNWWLLLNSTDPSSELQWLVHELQEAELNAEKVHIIDRAIGIAYIGPSVTPYYDLNPGYRIYYVDGNHEQTTRAVIDHETWIMNLQEANLHGYPIWFKLYSARMSFQMKALRPQDWHELVQKMTNDSTIFDLFYRFYYKSSPVRPNCDTNCKTRLLCDLRVHSSRSNDRKNLCNNYKSTNRK